MPARLVATVTVLLAFLGIAAHTAGAAASGSSCSVPQAGKSSPGLNLQGCDLRNTNLATADLSGSDFSGADLRNTNLKGARLVGAKFIDSRLDGSTLAGADLTDAWIQADMGPYLHRIDLRRANLTRTWISYALFKGVNMRGANAAAARIESAKWVDTVCPDGYRVRGSKGSCTTHL